MYFFALLLECVNPSITWMIVWKVAVCFCIYFIIIIIIVLCKRGQISEAGSQHWSPPELWSSSLFAVWELQQRRATNLNISQNSAEKSMKEKESAKVLLIMLFTDASGDFSRNDQIIKVNTAKISMQQVKIDQIWMNESLRADVLHLRVVLTCWAVLQNISSLCWSICSRQTLLINLGSRSKIQFLSRSNSEESSRTRLCHSTAVPPAGNFAVVHLEYQKIAVWAKREGIKKFEAFAEDETFSLIVHGSLLSLSWNKLEVLLLDGGTWVTSSLGLGFNFFVLKEVLKELRNILASADFIWAKKRKYSQVSQVCL